MHFKRIVAAVTAALATAAAAPAAHADSISYIKDGNIWLTTPDGTRQVQVTSDGGYSFASQADDGTLLGLWGQRLRRLDRQGNVLADFSTPVSGVPEGAAFTSLGPIDPQISPDGTKVAYGYHFNYVRYDPYCGHPGGCREGKVLIGTGYSHADRTTAWDEPGLGRHSGWSFPSWIDNSHVLLSDVAEILNDQVWIDTVGDGQHGIPWFQRSNEATVRDGELNRQGDLIALVESRSSRDDMIRISQLRQPMPASPWSCLTIEGDVAYRAPTGYGSPSFSPDGRSLAYDTGKDLAVVREIDTAGCTGARAAQVLVPGATKPDWGPADVPVAPAPAPVPAPEAGTGEPGTSRPGDAAADAQRPRIIVRGVRLGQALRRGLRVTVLRCTAGKRVTARAKVGRLTVARGSGRCSGSRSTVTLRFTRAARQRLARRDSARLVIDAAGASVHASFKR